jgi:Ulp1 family protease
MNFFMELQAVENPDNLYCSTFFYARLYQDEEKYSYSAIANWIKKVTLLLCNLP